MFCSLHHKPEVLQVTNHNEQHNKVQELCLSTDSPHWNEARDQQMHSEAVWLETNDPEKR